MTCHPLHNLVFFGNSWVNTSLLCLVKHVLQIERNCLLKFLTFRCNIDEILVKLQIRRDIYIIFSLFLSENICCGYSLEAPHRGASNEYPQHMFLCRNKKNISIFRMKKTPDLLLCPSETFMCYSRSIHVSCVFVIHLLLDYLGYIHVLEIWT